jgi:2,4-dienoyl-CoA reductase (NADPH2)
VGTIITGVVAADFFASDEPWKGEGLKGFIQGLHQLVEDVHREGAKIGVQIWYGNRYPAYKAVRERGGERVAPSPRVGKTEWWEEVGEMRELTIGEIEDIISKFAKGARGVKEAGFDFVELHGAHGYLLCQFFSPIYNRRKDQYGGDLKGRMRFGLECISAVRREVGEDFPIFYRLGAWEDKLNGVNVEDSLQFAVELERAGVDVLDVSVAAGIDTLAYNEFDVCPPKKAPMATFAWIAQAIKSKVHIPVIAVGRINSHKVAEEVLVQGKADLIALGRQLIADPFWAKKVKEGRFKEIITCQSCNQKCFDHLRGKSFGCQRNPRAGKELDSPPPE